MSVLLIGFGQAGGNILDEFHEYERGTSRQFIGGSVAINSAKADLMELEHVPSDNRVLIGESKVKGHGVGADSELGAEIAEADIAQIQGAIDNVSFGGIDAVMIVAGLGGGTGAGGAPVLATHLERIYVQPIYGLGVLPSRDEGGIYTMNAARSVRKFASAVENLLLFDNDVWKSEPVPGNYEEINTDLVRRFGSILSGTEANGDSTVRVRSRDLIETLESGGFTAVGFAAEEVERPSSGLLSSLTGGSAEPIDESEVADRITSLVRKAALGKLTLPCDIEQAESALLVLSGPPEYLDPEPIKECGEWLGEQIGTEHVHAGTNPLERDRITATVLLSGLDDVSRITELEERGREAGARIEELSEEAPDDLDGMASTEREDTTVEADPTATTTDPEPTGAEKNDASEDGSAPDSTTPPEAKSRDSPTSSPSSSKPSTESFSSADSDGEGAFSKDRHSTESTAEGTTDTASEPDSDGEAASSTSGGAASASPATQENNGFGDEYIPDPGSVASPPRRSLSYEDFTIVEGIGSGGQALIRKVRTPGDSSEVVALREPNVSKTVTGAIAEEFLSRAETWKTIDTREREKPRWDDYEHVVGVIATGKSPLPWVAMEYMDGGSLAELLAEHPDGLPIGRALWIGECVCKGLEIAHQLGRAHLDVKPENVLLTRTDDGLWPKIADWGLARTLANETGSMDALSVEYAGPEQFDADEFGDPDQLTDIYQTGALVYALLTGAPPTTGGQLEVMKAVIGEEPIAPPSDRRPELTPAVDAVVGLALEREKTDRYDSISEFRKALHTVRTGERLPSAVVTRIEE